MGHETGAEAMTEPIELDTVLDTLNHPHRRAILRFLYEHPEDRISAETMVSYLREREEGRTGEKPSSERISTDLYHIHAPKLDDVGLVTFDRSRRELQYHPEERVETWLDFIDATHESE